MLFLQLLYNGVALGGLYAILGATISIVFGLTRIVFFVVGMIIILAAYSVWQSQDLGAPFWLAAPIAVGLAGGLCLALEQGLFRFTLREPTGGFLVSLGLIIALQNLVIEVWSTDTRSVAPPVSEVWEIGGVRVTAISVAVIVCSLLTLLLFFGLIMKTRFGRALRAVSENPSTALLMGIPVPRVIALTFLLGGFLLGAVGVLLISITPVNPFTSEGLLLKGFTVAMVGGLGRVHGAAAAGYLVGILESLAIGYLNPSALEAYIGIALVVVLIIRPSGLVRGAEGARI